jgi:ABC-2 type transport system permease protein
LIYTKIRKYATIIQVSLTNAFVYRAVIFARFGFYALFIYVFMSLWRAIYQEGSVHGYSYIQIVWYLIVTEFIVFSSNSGFYTQMSEDIKTGEIAYFLGRPTHYVLYQLANSAGQILVNMGFIGLLGLSLGLIFVGPLDTFRPEGIPAMLIAIALGLVLNFFVLMLIGLSAFVMEDNTAMYLIYQKLVFMLGMFLPVEFLPAWLQPVALSLPFSYVCWAPAKLVVDYSPPLFVQLVSRQLMWVVLLMAAVFFVYRICQRRLQVNGG